MKKLNFKTDILITIYKSLILSTIITNAITLCSRDKLSERRDKLSTHLVLFIQAFSNLKNEKIQKLKKLFLKIRLNLIG